MSLKHLKSPSLGDKIEAQRVEGLENTKAKTVEVKKPSKAKNK